MCILLRYYHILWADINLLQRDNTALIHAASDGHKEIVSMLLAIEGIDVNAKDKVSLNVYILVV